jgi:hypothetical protein
MLRVSLIDPHGDLVEVKNVAKLCRENDLSVYQMHCVINGTHHEHRGWKLAKEKDNEYTIIDKMAFNLKKKEKRAKLLARMMYESKPTGETFNFK